MANLPPGPLYLSRLIAHSIPPSVVGYIILRVLVKHFNFGISFSLLVIAALFTRPTCAILSSIWSDWSNWLDAKRQGAVIVQHVRDPWPGGLGVVAAMVKSFKSGYPGKRFPSTILIRRSRKSGRIKATYSSTGASNMGTPIPLG